MKQRVARMLLAGISLLFLAASLFFRPCAWPVNPRAVCTGALHFAQGLRPVTLRAGTYNAKHFELGAHDFARYADLIRASGLDVLAVQEVDNGTARSGGLKEARLLAEELGWHFRFAPAVALDGGEYGLAILSRYPMGELTVHKYAATDAEQRILAAVTVTVDGTEIRVLNTHLSPDLHDPATGAALRAEQFAQLSAITGELRSYLLLGDLNTDTPSELALASRIRWANGAERALITCPAGNAAIDNLGTGQNGRFSGVTVVSSPLSDHHLLYADITILAAK